MRTTAKITMTALFTAGLLGMGFGSANAGEWRGYDRDNSVDQACVYAQDVDGTGLLGLGLGLQLNLLNNCINFNDD